MPEKANLWLTCEMQVRTRATRREQLALTPCTFFTDTSFSLLDLSRAQRASSAVIRADIPSSSKQDETVLALRERQRLMTATNNKDSASMDMLLVH